MNKIVFCVLAMFSLVKLQAQQKEGKVIYQRTVQMQIRIADNAGPEREMPRTRTDKFEMDFANGQMIIRQMDDEMPEENPGGGGMMIRSFGGADDVTFCDLEKSKKVELREFFDKKFLITDSIRRGNWKLTDETKTILTHLCRKATSQRIGKRMMMSMDNGKMVRKEVDDTSTIVAWFTTDIPVSVGPEVQGQLPGLILSLETNNGRSVYTAVEISPKAAIAAIKEPTKGKKVTPDEFAKERNKMMDEMQKNNPGGNIRMRMN
ncbi:GLPGLI family protein [Terrimonas alba]|uniref:GLPGLI family protein n=1 Tax=Terrimonas alba TaxID=3349636 RepID=UPI0035F3D477